MGLGIAYEAPADPQGYCAVGEFGQGVGAYVSVASGSERVCDRLYSNSRATDLASGCGLISTSEELGTDVMTGTQTGSASMCDENGYRYDLEITGGTPPERLMQEVMELAMTL